MATTPTLERADVEEIEVGHDIIDGVRVERTMSVESGLIGGELYAAMRDFARSGGLGRTFPVDVGYKIFPEPHVLKFADASFIRAQRLSSESLRRPFLGIPPDIAAEVVSPSDNAYQVEAKALAWIAVGTQLVWVLFPGTKSVHVYRADGRDEILGASDMLSGEDILPGFEIAIADLMPSEIPTT